MKFDYIIGNPPYQEESAGEKIMDQSIYDKFMDNSFKCANKVCLITPARFLFNAGATSKQWNKKMLDDEHFKVIYYEPLSSKIFPNTDIKGGVAISFRNANENFGAIKTFTPHNELNSIRKKVVNREDFESIENIISIQNNFDLKRLLSEHPEYIKYIGSDGHEKRVTSSIFRKIDAFKEEKSSQDIQIIGIIKNKRISKYILKDYINDNGNLYGYKVILPKNMGSGEFGETISKPIIGEPLTGYTQSFIGIGNFNTKEEAETCEKYLKTKFARSLLSLLKVTHNGSKNVYKYVPLQDFTENSEIDWSKSIPEIDQQLYKKYELSEEEIEFIETHVKEMD